MVTHDDGTGEKHTPMAIGEARRRGKSKQSHCQRLPARRSGGTTLAGRGCSWAAVTPVSPDNRQGDRDAAILLQRGATIAE